MKTKPFLLCVVLLISFSSIYARKNVVKIYAPHENLTKKKGKVYCKVVHPASPIDKIYVMSNKEFEKKVDWVGRMKHMNFAYHIIVRIKSSRQVRNKIYYYCTIVKRVGPKQRSGM